MGIRPKREDTTNTAHKNKQNKGQQQKTTSE